MTTTTRHEVEELLEIVRNLPVSRVEEVLDFARFLEWRSRNDQAVSDDELEGASDAENEAWDTIFANERSQQLLSRLALQAIAEDETGATTALLFDADGNLID